MAGNARFHSKYHSKSHHTNSTPGYYDSAADPIASPADPFQGDFYLNGTLSATRLIANSQFVNVLSAGGYALTIKALTGNYSVLTTDFTLLVHGGSASAGLLMPAASSVPSQEFIFKRTSESTTVTLSAAGSDLFERTYNTIDLTTFGAAVHVISYQNVWWVIDPSLAASS